MVSVQDPLEAMRSATSSNLLPPSDIWSTQLLLSSLPPASSSSSPKTHPSLPTELLASILAFCDTPSLAVCSRVSLAFLQMAGPILYEEVVLFRREDYELLFCKRIHRCEHIEPFLSLTQIKSLSLEIPPSTPFSHDRLPLSPTDQKPLPIPLHTLSIALLYSGLIGYAPILSLFLPAHFRLHSAFHHSSKFTFDIDRSSWRVFTSAQWRASLRTVWMVGCCLRVIESGGQAFRGDDQPLQDVDEDEDDRPFRFHFVYVPDFFLVPSSQEEKAVGERSGAGLSIVFDLTQLPRLTTELFYTHFLSQRRLDGVFTVPGIRQPIGPGAHFGREQVGTYGIPRWTNGQERRALMNGVTVLVRRERERGWVKKGFEKLDWEKEFVKVLVVESLM